MKFRWKLLILFMLIAIVPVVGLRSFGIHNVHLMADALTRQIRQTHDDHTRMLLEVLTDGYTRMLARVRQQVELALDFQVLALQRSLSCPMPGGSTAGGLPAGGAGTDGLKPGAAVSLHGRGGACLVAAADAGAVLPFDHTRGRTWSAFMESVSRTAKRQLGKLVVRQYTALKNGICSVYPCDANLPRRFDARRQVWYRTALAARGIVWTPAFRDAASGLWVTAAAAAVYDGRRKPAGVASIVVSLENLADSAAAWKLPAGSRMLIVRPAGRRKQGRAGARVLVDVPVGETATRPATSGRSGAHWLTSADQMQFKSMLRDFAGRISRIREMPVEGRLCFLAYGPLPGEAGDFVFIIPRNASSRLFTRVQTLIDRRVRRVEYFTAGFLVLLILLAVVLALGFSRTVTKPLEALAAASRRLAGGDFETRVAIKSDDEFGQMGRIFNEVGPQLKLHAQVQQSLAVAREIQQSLLPDAAPQVAGLDIEGATLYSDETGGDLLDYLCVGEKAMAQLCVVVGDVSGHGISSAILMATVRAALRLRASSSGPLAEIVTDINRQFACDVEKSCQFMTLFLARINRTYGWIQWVRAGHEPGVLYDPQSDTLHILKGGGLPLGIRKETEFEAFKRDIRSGQIILISTDGVLEARNPAGEFFGRQRLYAVLRRCARQSAREIVREIFEAVGHFRGARPQEDDITLVVVKVLEDSDAPDRLA